MCLRLQVSIEIVRHKLVAVRSKQNYLFTKKGEPEDDTAKYVS